MVEQQAEIPVGCRFESGAFSFCFYMEKHNFRKEKIGMEKSVYIHYGAKSFDPGKGFPIHNQENWPKPKGGLWGSREMASFGWKDWCECENFRKCDISDAFRFILRDGAKVGMISCMADLKKLPVRKCSRQSLWQVLLDFEECLHEGYDAIELCWYGEEYRELAADDMHFALYGWDCDSIVVLKPSAVIPVLDNPQISQIL